MTIVLALLVLLLSIGFVLLITGAIAVVMLDGDAEASAADPAGVAAGAATGAAR